MKLWLSTIIALAVLATSASPASSHSIASGAVMKHHAKGPFEVRLNLLDTYDSSDPTFQRRSLNKQFHGDLQATSRGEMLSYGSPAGSGGYVAIEHVIGTLQGHTGSFALQHNATMNHGVPHMNIIVVPGSGTGELEGLDGRMTIHIAADGAHSYDFQYTLNAVK